MEKKNEKSETHHAGAPRGLVGVFPVKGTSVVGQDPRAPAGEARRGLGEREGRREEEKQRGAPHHRRRQQRRRLGYRRRRHRRRRSSVEYSRLCPAVFARAAFSARHPRVASKRSVLGGSQWARFCVERERERKEGEVLIERRCLSSGAPPPSSGARSAFSRGDNWSSTRLFRDSPQRKRSVSNSALPCGHLKCQFAAPRCTEGMVRKNEAAHKKGPDLEKSKQKKTIRSTRSGGNQTFCAPSHPNQPPAIELTLARLKKGRRQSRRAQVRGGGDHANLKKVFFFFF